MNEVLGVLVQAMAGAFTGIHKDLFLIQIFVVLILILIVVVLVLQVITMKKSVKKNNQSSAIKKQAPKTNYNRRFNLK